MGGGFAAAHLWWGWIWDLYKCVGSFYAHVFGVLGCLRDVLLRHSDATYFGRAILQYVNGVIGTDGEARNKLCFVQAS